MIYLFVDGSYVGEAYCPAFMGQRISEWEAKAMRKALALFQEPDLLKLYRRNGMSADFSWAQTASQYQALYQRLAER